MRGFELGRTAPRALVHRSTSDTVFAKCAAGKECHDMPAGFFLRRQRTRSVRATGERRPGGDDTPSGAQPGTHDHPFHPL